MTECLINKTIDFERAIQNNFDGLAELTLYEAGIIKMNMHLIIVTKPTKPYLFTI